MRPTLAWAFEGWRLGAAQALAALQRHPKQMAQSARRRQSLNFKSTEAAAIMGYRRVMHARKEANLYDRPGGVMR